MVDALTLSVANKIAAEIKPEKIIVFGSCAAGKARQDSDIDLPIIYQGPLSKREVELAVHRLFPDPEFSLGLFVLTPGEFAWQQHVVSTLGRIGVLWMRK